MKITIPKSAELKSIEFTANTDDARAMRDAINDSGNGAIKAINVNDKKYAISGLQFSIESDELLKPTYKQRRTTRVSISMSLHIIETNKSV